MAPEENDPASHEAQVFKEVFANVPAPQLAQNEAPVDADMVPEAQVKQSATASWAASDVPASERYVPAGQSVQAEAAADEYLPTPQIVKDCAPEPDVADPAGASVQAVLIPWTLAYLPAGQAVMLHDVEMLVEK